MKCNKQTDGVGRYMKRPVDVDGDPMDWSDMDEAFGPDCTCENCGHQVCPVVAASVPEPEQCKQWVENRAQSEVTK